MAFNKYAEWFPLCATVDVGVATKQFTYQVPFACRIMQLNAAADAADATDKVTVSVVVDATTVITGTVTNAADTVVVTTSPDAGTSFVVPANTNIKVTTTYAGTAANVKGVAITLWCQPTR